MKNRKPVSAACFAAILFAGGAQAQISNFGHDVNTAIDRGLTFLDNMGAYNVGGSACGDAAGLCALALLEKRVSADANANHAGYANATAADKARLDNIMAFIIARSTVNGFYAYRDGADLMALSIYATTGGPDLAGASNALRAVFDRTAVSQGAPATFSAGYWCYHDGNCADASTTQLVMSGLAAARSAFSSSIAGLNDPGRLATLNNLAANTRAAYAANGIPGPTVLEATEEGHGYNQGNENSLHQTSSGIWGQIIGGASLNNSDVQGYLRWVRNRYNYQNIDSAGGGWAFNSYFYFLWSSAKAFTFIERSGVAAAPGNLSTADLGLLAPGDAPAFAGRLAHRDPTTDARPAGFADPLPNAGTYQAETPRWYYDYAYTLMTYQSADGGFRHPTASGWAGPFGWETTSSQSYAILVLQRSVGGGCADTDRDGICDERDNCPTIANPGQADGDHDGIGDACEQVGECAVDSDCPDDNNNCTIDSCNAGLCVHLPDPICGGCDDADADGICDTADNCPNTPNPDQADSDGDGKGDACDSGGGGNGGGSNCNQGVGNGPEGCDPGNSNNHNPSNDENGGVPGDPGRGGGGKKK